MGERLKHTVLGVSAAAIAGVPLAIYLGLSFKGISEQDENIRTSGEPVQRLNPRLPAMIIAEASGGGDADPSLLLRQTLSDGTTVTARRPVFIGEVAIREPGQQVVPSELEPPLPDRP